MHWLHWRVGVRVGLIKPSNWGLDTSLLSRKCIEINGEGGGEGPPRHPCNVIHHMRPPSSNAPCCIHDKACGALRRSHVTSGTVDPRSGARCRPGQA